MMVERPLILMVCSRDVWWNSPFFWSLCETKSIGFCKVRLSLARHGSHNPRVTWRSCPDFCGLEVGRGRGWMLIHRNNGRIAMFQQQQDLDEGESMPCIRQYFLRHPLHSHPSFTIFQRHHSTPTSVQISKCRREGKKYCRFTETSTVKPLKTRGIMWLVKTEVCTAQDVHYV